MHITPCKLKRLSSYFAIALICAIASYWYFSSYPELVVKLSPAGSPIAGLTLSILGLLLLSLPCIFLIVYASPELAILREIHAACYLCFLLLVSYVSGSPGHSSFGSQFASDIETVLYTILAVELLVIIGSNWRQGYLVIRGVIFMAIAIALLGGWFIGAYLWSIKIPSKVLAAAEVEAGKNAYCIEAAGELVQSKSDLNAFNMYVRDYNGWTMTFHGLLVIQEKTGRKYMNWSYRDNKFHLVSNRFLQNKSYDTKTCTPVKNFGKNLSL